MSMRRITGSSNVHKGLDHTPNKKGLGKDTKGGNSVPSGKRVHSTYQKQRTTR